MTAAAAALFFLQAASNPGSLVDQGEALLEQGRFGEAEKVLERALRETPRDPRALHAMGLLQYSQDRFAEAEEHLRRSAEGNPRSFGTRLLLAACLLRQEKNAEAVGELEFAHGLKPENADAAKLLAIEYSKQSRHRDAAQVLRPALNASPGDEELYLLLIEAHHRSGNYQLSLELARTAVRRFPESARLHYWIGFQTGRLGQFPEAESALRQALELDPGYQSAYHALADALLQQYLHEKAADLLRRALANHADDVQALLRMGKALAGAGKLKDALQPLEKAAALAPGYSPVRLELSRVYFRLGDKERARREAETYRDLRAKSPQPESDVPVP